jgi:hypothetical protein
MKKLTDLYEGLELNETTYLGNALNMTMFGTNYAFSKLREQVKEINNGRHSYLEALFAAKSLEKLLSVLWIKHIINLINCFSYFFLFQSFLI